MRNNNFIAPSDEEDARINAGIALDEDNPELTEIQFARLRPFVEAFPDLIHADYDRAVQEIEQYFDNEPAPMTPEANRFDALTALINTYDSTNYAINTTNTKQHKE